MYLAIDGRPMVRRPHGIGIRSLRTHDVTFNGQGRSQVFPEADQVQVVATFGRDLSYQDVMGELHRKRAHRGIHSITFEPIAGGRPLTINAYMGKPSQEHIGVSGCGKIVTTVLAVPFIQVDSPTFLYEFRLDFPGIISIMSPYTFHEAPAAGEFISIDGVIEDLGAGGGQTRIQVYNNTQAKNYLSTPGDFDASAPPVYTLQNAVLASDLTFEGGDRIDGNVTDIPALGMSAEAVVYLWAWLYHP